MSDFLQFCGWSGVAWCGLFVGKSPGLIRLVTLTHSDHSVNLPLLSGSDSLSQTSGTDGD